MTSDFFAEIFRADEQLSMGESNGTLIPTPIAVRIGVYAGIGSIESKVLYSESLRRRLVRILMAWQ
jgi:hypothetical protein